MQNPSQELAKRFSEVMLNGKLIANTNFKDQLEQCDYNTAIAQIGGHNTIAALTFHINYYIQGVMQVLNGGPLEIRDKFSFDMPTIDTPEKWVQLRQSLLENAEKMRDKIEALTPDQLQAPFIKEAYGNYQHNMEMLVEHGYYHLGQISLLRKLIQSGI